MNHQQPEISPRRILRFDARGVLDCAGTCASSGSVLVEVDGRESGCRLRTIAAGRTADVLTHEAAQLPATQIVSRPDMILIPGLVNAHTHLDLTHIGPQPHQPGDGFVGWVEMIRAGRHIEDERIAASVRRGAELSLSAGTVAVGDIAGAPAGRLSLVPWRTLRQTKLQGVSYLEFFGIGKTRDLRAAGLEKLIGDIAEEASGQHAVRLGLQPHAPNTVSFMLYLLASRLARALPGAPTCTHLAETPEEREFIAKAAGPQREMLERLGIWDDSILDEIGKGQHPVEYLAEVLAEKRFAVAHVNDAPDSAIETMAQTQTRVVYCPRASDYFGAAAHFGQHRYRDMLAAGIPVALGTDSLVNLPPYSARMPSEGGRGMSILDEMRFLHRRDGTDPLTLLRMGTVNGAMALGLEPEAFTFRSGGVLAGLVGVEAGGSDLGKSLLSGVEGRVELLLV